MDTKRYHEIITHIAKVSKRANAKAFKLEADAVELLRDSGYVALVPWAKAKPYNEHYEAQRRTNEANGRSRRLEGEQKTLGRQIGELEGKLTYWKGAISRPINQRRYNALQAELATNTEAVGRAASDMATYAEQAQELEQQLDPDVDTANLVHFAKQKATFVHVVVDRGRYGIAIKRKGWEAKAFVGSFLESGGDRPAHELLDVFNCCYEEFQFTAKAILEATAGEDATNEEVLTARHPELVPLWSNNPSPFTKSDLDRVDDITQMAQLDEVSSLNFDVAKIRTYLGRRIKLHRSADEDGVWSNLVRRAAIIYDALTGSHTDRPLKQTGLTLAAACSMVGYKATSDISESATQDIAKLFNGARARVITLNRELNLGLEQPLIEAISSIVAYRTGNLTYLRDTFPPMQSLIQTATKRYPQHRPQAALLAAGYFMGPLQNPVLAAVHEVVGKSVASCKLEGISKLLAEAELMRNAMIQIKQRRLGSSGQHPTTKEHGAQQVSNQVPIPESSTFDLWNPSILMSSGYTGIRYKEKVTRATTKKKTTTAKKAKKTKKK